jgi:hypothetical protein
VRFQIFFKIEAQNPEARKTENKSISIFKTLSADLHIWKNNFKAAL